MFPVIKVTGNGHTYMARHNGKSASCTYSARVATEALCQKLWPDHEYELKELGKERTSDGNKTIAEFQVCFFQMPESAQQK